MAKKKKYYVVWEGVHPGIYSSWEECQQQIKGFPNAKYKSFSSFKEAQTAFETGFASYLSSVAKKPSPPSFSKTEMIVRDSISVDAACSGNPGELEYQGVHTQTGQQLFHKHFELGTNNIGEFLAIVHALAWLFQQGKTLPVYSDSATAIKWVRQKKCKTQLKRTAKTDYLFQLIERAEKWLENHPYSNPILKWDTENWGEIPADFGRK